MNYVAPFSAILKQLTVSQRSEGELVSARYSDLLAALRCLLAGIPVDEQWYLEQNPDIARAIEAGTIRSANQHFIDHGYFEGRAPYRVAVDERWYLANNPDVAENIRKGRIGSAQEHFDSNGYREGRLPSAPDDKPTRAARRLLKPP